MGKTSKPKEDVPETPAKTKLEKTPEEIAERARLLREVVMPESHIGVTALDLTADQKNKVKVSSQHMFGVRKKVTTKPPPRTIRGASNQLAELMAAKLKEMKSKKASKK